MDKTVIEAVISAQSKLVESLPIDKAFVTEIDRHFKDVEKQLNERLVHISAGIMIKDFLPRIPLEQMVTKVDDNLWNSFRFDKALLNQKSMYEEMSFEKFTKGYGFFYRMGEVTYDLGACKSTGGVDWYFRVIEDRRESVKVTGAAVDVKLKAAQHLGSLLAQINHQAHNINDKIRSDLTRDALERFPGMQVVGNWNSYFNYNPFASPQANPSLAEEFAQMGQADAARLLEGNARDKTPGRHNR